MPQKDNPTTTTTEGDVMPNDAQTTTDTSNRKEYVMKPITDILHDPNFLARLDELATTAIKFKLYKEGRIRKNEIDEYVPEVTAGMWLEVAESDDPAVTGSDRKELARIAHRVLGRYRRAEESVEARLAIKGPRTDQSSNLGNWNALAPIAQVDLAGRFSASRHLSSEFYRKCLDSGKRNAAARVLDKAQAVLSAHTLLNRKGLGGKVRTISKGDFKLKKPGVTMKGLPAPKGQVDTKGGKTRNLGTLWKAHNAGHISQTVPIYELQEYSLRQSRSAETEMFRSIREQHLIPLLADFSYLSLFYPENGTCRVNWSEAYAAVNGHAPGPKERTRFKDTIRHQVDFLVGDDRMVLKHANPDEQSYMGRKVRKAEEAVLASTNWQGPLRPGRNVLLRTYSDKALQTGRMYLPDTKRDEEVIRAEIVEVGTILSNLTGMVTDWTEGTSELTLGETVRNAQDLRKALDRLYSELMDN